MSRFNLSALAVRERSITLFLIVAIILSGAYAFLRLGRAEDPTFVIKTLTVTAVWPGATARQMQDLVAEPLEKRMQELRWYDRVETFTRPGIAVMMVTLSDKTPASAVAEEFYQARKKLGDEAPKLPAGVQGPFVNDEYSDVIFAVYGLEAHGMPPRELTREAERLRQRLLHVSGVKKVNIQGERPERIFVEFSYARLANLGLSPRDIFDALQRQNAVTPAGSIDTNGPQVFMRLDGAYDDLQKIRDTPMSAGGRAFRLADIAEVKPGYEDPPTFLIRHDGEAALVFVVMLLTGRVFDRITLGALVIALGLLVDDAIIAIEMMVVKLEEGFERVKAAAYAWSHTAAPMLSGTLVTIIGFTPVGFAHSTAGEYAGNIFWIVGYALIVSWLVAVVFTPYLGVKLLPDIAPVPGGHTGIYSTPRYQRLRRLIAWAVDHRFKVAGMVVAVFLLAGLGMGFVKRQFFPSSDRPEVLVEVQMPEGTSIEATTAAAIKVEGWVRQQHEAKIVTTYIGQGAPRFFFSYNPELPDPAFAKLVILTPDARARDRLKLRLRERIAQGLVPEARVRVSQLIFGPYPRYLVNFRVMGPDPDQLRIVANQVQAVMRANPHTRQVNQDWGERTPTVHFVLDQNRLQLMGLSSSEAAQQLQFLLTGVPVTQVREDIRTVDVVAHR